MHNRQTIICCAMLIAVLLAGCHAGLGWSDVEAGDVSQAATKKHKRTIAPQNRIRKVYCLYSASPWLNLDRHGDLDPEGIQYRVFLSPGTDNTFKKGVLQKGTFHIEMYGIKRSFDGTVSRELVSDWHYPASVFPPIKSKYNGKGYHIKLRWAKKEMAGTEIELITEFEDVDGNTVRSATKNFPIPKYTS